jgi:hypothetical protein
MAELFEGLRSRIAQSYEGQDGLISVRIGRSVLYLGISNAYRIRII